MSADQTRKLSISERAMAAATAAPAAESGTETAPYLKNLNEEQRLAVLTTEGPVLMLAGAGTGKTRALTTRLAHLLRTGRAQPWQLLAVTFTNKAAREMKERIAALVGDHVEGMQWLGTFHSIGAQILRRHAELAGLKSSFTILDADDQVRLCKQVIEAANIDEKRWTGRGLAAVIDGWKNRGLTPDKVPANEGFHFADGKGIDLYKAYQARLITSERRRLRRSSDSQPDDLPEQSGRAWKNISAVSATCWSTNIRTPTSRNIYGCGCSRKSTKTSAASATTTSRSMAGAARKLKTSCVLKKTFRARP